MHYLKNLNSFEKFCEKYNRKYFYAALFEFYCHVNGLNHVETSTNQVGTKDGELIADISNPRISFDRAHLLLIDGERLTSILPQTVIAMLKEIARK